MSVFSRWLPADVLGRARLASVVVVGLSVVGQAFQVGNPMHPRSWHIASAVAIALLMAVFGLTAWRGRTLPGDPVLLPVLVVVGGSGLLDPITTVGLAIAVVVAQSLYGSLAAWVVRSVGAIAAVPVAVALTPMVASRPVAWNSPTVLGVLPQLALMAVMMRSIYIMLLRQAQAGAREAVLARTGSRLLGLTDVAQVRSLGAEAAAQLAALTPGVLVRDLTPVPVGRRQLADDVRDAFRTLGHQLALAEASCVSHAELSHRAHHDQLTTLPTRALFLERLQAAIDADTKAGTCTVALLNIDLDDFKQVNDAHGHAAGDELLIEVASRLTAAGGAGSVAARFGGDEFALLLTGLSDPAEAERLAERVCRRVIEPVHLRGATVSVGASIGVATSDPALTAGDLLRCADIAMYSAKARGKNRVERFTAARHGGIAHHRMLEEHLVTAVERDEIVLRYQPYADLRTGECTGVEAVPYWRHPTLGLLPPREFLPLAERTGQSVALGTYVLRAACRQLAAWDGIPGTAVPRIGVDTSARQLLDPAFAATVARTLAEAGLAADRLVLEIVESEHLDDEVARDELQRITATGVLIALDDFGTGYVSFGALRSFPIAQIKLHPSFVGEPSGGETLQLVISVGRVLGAEPVVQGVSSAEQAAGLPAGAAGQGPFVAPVMAPNEVPEWLALHVR